MIDYLSEDPIFNNMNYVLISIVSPVSTQKSSNDEFFMAIRGFCKTQEECKTLSDKIFTKNNKYDIFTAPVGKFFPIFKDNTVYSESEQLELLNDLVKGYIKQKFEHDDLWLKNKNDRVKNAKNEGLGELTKEHPISVLNKIKMCELNIAKYQEELDSYTLKITS